MLIEDMWMEQERKGWKEICRIQQSILEELEDMKRKIEQCQYSQRIVGPTDILPIEEKQGTAGRPLLEKMADGPQGYIEEFQFAREVEECLARRGRT